MLCPAIPRFYKNRLCWTSTSQKEIEVVHKQTPTTCVFNMFFSLQVLEKKHIYSSDEISPSHKRLVMSWTSPQTMAGYRSDLLERGMETQYFWTSTEMTSIYNIDLTNNNKVRLVFIIVEHAQVQVTCFWWLSISQKGHLNKEGGIKLG